MFGETFGLHTVQSLDFSQCSVKQQQSQRRLGKQQRPCTNKTRLSVLKPDSSDTRQLFIMTSLQENVSVCMKRVKPKVFIQDLFSPLLFSELRCKEICRCEQHSLCPNLL